MAEESGLPRVMADANVVISGILFPRWFHEFLRHALRGDFQLVLSEQVVREARARMERGTPAQVAALEQFLVDCVPEVVPDPDPEEVRQHPTLVRDAKDIPIALAAIAAGVDHLVSNDKDLTADDETTAELRRRIRPVTVGRFLHEVMGWSSEDLDRIRLRAWADMPADGPASPDADQTPR